MNAALGPTRSADIAALAMATDAQGQVDLTALEAHRLILGNQTIQGLDAQGLVTAITGSAAYADPQGRGQVGPLLKAISNRLPPADAVRFASALDEANVNEHWAERIAEQYLEAPLAAAWESAKARGSQALGWTDSQIAGALAQSTRWAREVRDNPHNSYLERAAGRLATNASESGQTHYGAMKGATSHGLRMLGDTVDLAKLAYQFQTDGNFRNLIIGAAAVYTSQAIDEPGKVPRDIRNAAIGAWNEWERGLEQAQQQGTEQQYLGQAQGAVAIEIIATFVPVSKLAKLGKVAEVAHAVDDIAPVAGRVAGQAERRAAGELTEEVLELAHDARQLQGKVGLGARSADLAFHGLAGVKRSHGELGELVEGLRKAGHLDGLLDSGALTPKELGYLARQDVRMFDGSVSFEQAITKSVGNRELLALTRAETGDIGEALVARELAEAGYTDLVPIQNNSGHGNDLVGFNTKTERWEVVEVKASAKGAAKDQVGDPQRVIIARLERAIEARGHWDPKNMWEEDARAMAERLIDNHFDDTTRHLDVDSKWARVNLERSPETGHIGGKPTIDDWHSPAQRALEQSNASPVQSGQTPANPGHADYAMHEQIRGKVGELGITGVANDQMTASLLALAKGNGLTQVDHIALGTPTPGRDGAQNVFVIQGEPADPTALRAYVSSAQAAQAPVEQSFAQVERVNQQLANDQTYQEQNQIQRDSQMRMG